jgi:hypothetical protein
MKEIDSAAIKMAAKVVSTMVQASTPPNRRWEPESQLVQKMLGDLASTGNVAKFCLYRVATDSK